MCACIVVFESILRVKIGSSSIWWVPLIRLSSFHNKIHVNENTESLIILNKIRSLLGGSSEHGFREHRSCYIHGRTHVDISDVAKCGKVSWPTSQIKRYFFTVTIVTVRQLPTLQCTVIGLTRERFVALGLPSWTHLRTRCWGVFTLQGLKDLLRALGLWYCERWGIGENEKVKADSTTQRCFL